MANGKCINGSPPLPQKKTHCRTHTGTAVQISINAKLQRGWKCETTDHPHKLTTTKTWISINQNMPMKLFYLKAFWARILKAPACPPHLCLGGWAGWWCPQGGRCTLTPWTGNRRKLGWRKVKGRGVGGEQQRKRRHWGWNKHNSDAFGVPEAFGGLWANVMM